MSISILNEAAIYGCYKTNCDVNRMAEFILTTRSVRRIKISIQLRDVYNGICDINRMAKFTLVTRPKGT